MSTAYPFAGKPIVMFDVSSPLADKGDAIEYLRDREHVRPDHVIVAGDGGNDITMMRTKDGVDEGRRAIAVGGGSELYRSARELKNAILQPAEMDCAEAVLDGLEKHLEAIAAENAA
jgi:hydroxymethylpyrimidine pyrophosphatase-like HAD family hydrolase